MVIEAHDMATAEPKALVELMLLQSAVSKPPSCMPSVAEQLALLSLENEAAQDWLSVLLAEGVCPLRSLVPDQGLALLSRLETYPSASKGTGAWVAGRVFELLRRRQGIGQVYLRPYPLQYELCSQRLSQRLFDARWFSFEQARERLQTYYAYTLGARPVPSSPGWMSLSLRPGQF